MRHKELIPARWVQTLTRRGWHNLTPSACTGLVSGSILRVMTTRPCAARRTPMQNAGAQSAEDGRRQREVAQRGAKHPDRCWWCGTDPIYVAYHDTEWGVPVVDDRALFEKLVLDGFQAGLSWITILKKREAFQRAFKQFEPEKIARFTERDVARLLTDDGIIRSRLKIEGAVKNARAWLEVMEAGDGAFRDLLWAAVDHRTIDLKLARREDIRAESAESRALAKTLKKRGFTFCGPVIVYAFMQAVGMYNEHLIACPRHRVCASLARK